LLVRWGQGLAVIYRVSATALVLGVPSGGAGNREISFDSFRELWGDEGEVLTLAANSLTPTRKFGFSWFLPAIRRHRTVLIEVLLASFFAQLFGLVNPLLIQQVIDKAIINSSPDALGLLGTMLVLFALFEGLLLTLRTFLFVDTTNRIDLSLGTAVIDHLLRLPISYFDRRPVGEVSSRIAELEKVRGFLTGTALTTILDASFAMLYLVVMVIYSWQLTLLTLAVIPILVVLVLSVSPIIRQQIQQRAIANARTQSHLVEVLNSMMTVKAQNIELRTRWRWQELYTDFVAEGFDNTLTSTIAGNVSNFLNTLSSLLVIWGGAYLVLANQLTLGELIAFRIISGNVTGPLLRMTSIWQSVQEVSLSLERLSDVIDTPQEADEDNYKRMVMPAIKGEIDFQNIEFRYKPSSPLQLRGVNLHIPVGSFVALVGTSGSGKSTLTKLVARLYPPETGRVLVDGIDISKVELYSLRRQLGIVPQDTVLFDGSVEENIALTNPDATTEEIIQAATVAAAHDFIMDLPAGYATQVGERGSGLSGGQRQRIAIARTILQRPNMLIMDEATSALDYQTERVVSENLMESLRGSTVLFITHRLSSITNADLIICMGQGTVLETGTHRELMASNGPYSVLYRQQGRSAGSSSSSSGSGSSSSSSSSRSSTPVMRSPNRGIGTA
jgi:ATP-binding cassette subfamily B protein